MAVSANTDADRKQHPRIESVRMTFSVWWMDQLKLSKV